MSDCSGLTPLAAFIGVLGGRALPTEWIVAHLNELAESDFDLLGRSTRKFHVVHSPRSHGYFAHSRFPFERLRALKFNICLATDSLASNESLSLFAEMRTFHRNEPGLSPDKIFEMVTVNPALAVDQSRQGGTLGRIRPGFQADLISIPCSGGTNLFEEIVAFDRPIDWMMVNGRM
jgi:cytosine/adenosine deaminase-related metal-dependent hydrolase